MLCTKHNKTEAVGTCVECGKFFCEDCFLKVGRKRYCKDCASDLLESNQKANNHGDIVITQQTSNNNTFEEQKHICSPPITGEVGGWCMTIFFFLLFLSSLTTLNIAAIFLSLVGIALWAPPLTKYLRNRDIQIWASVKLIASLVLFVVIIVSIARG